MHEHQYLVHGQVGEGDHLRVRIIMKIKKVSVENKYCIEFLIRHRAPPDLEAHAKLLAQIQGRSKS